MKSLGYMPLFAGNAQGAAQSMPAIPPLGASCRTKQRVKLLFILEAWSGPGNGHLAGGTRRIAAGGNQFLVECEAPLRLLSYAEPFACQPRYSGAVKFPAPRFQAKGL
jgi:hypothetical protein